VVLPIALVWGCSTTIPSNQPSSAPTNQVSSAPNQPSSTSSPSSEPISQASSTPSSTPTNQTGNTSTNQAVPAFVNEEESALATKIGKGIIAACPVADPGDSQAHALCSENLAKLTLLRDYMGEVILWGGQKEANNFKLKENHTTAFDPLVWRRTYLSTFMFSGEPKVEQQDGLTIIHLPIQFRNKLDIGAFPYPFWHSSKKWTSYQQATELLMVMKEGKIKGAMRSAEKDPQRPFVKHKWNGYWAWQVVKGEQEPRVTLYQNLFSKENPHVKNLDVAYRNFEVKMREHSCFICHDPSNANDMNPLLILNYPNQALTLRHRTVQEIEANTMPPNGIGNAQKRQELLALAKAFAAAGDKALAYEGEKPVMATQSSKSSGV
jgi:hypothetical protein